MFDSFAIANFPDSYSPSIPFALYCLGLSAAAFVGPKFGFYTYLLAYFMAPAGSWWRFMVPEFRYLAVAAVLALIAAYGRKDPYKGEANICTSQA